MDDITKGTMVDPKSHRCIYTEKWNSDGPVNPLHDWLLQVIKSGGTCDQPNELPKLVCSETHYYQTASGGRGDIWLLFATTKSPLKRDAVRRLTKSQVTFEVVYGVDHVTMKCDLGPNWLKAQKLVEELQKFRTTWVPTSSEQINLMFPTVDRGTDDTENELHDEAA